MKTLLRFISVSAMACVCLNMAEAGQAHWHVTQAGGSATGGDSLNSTRDGALTGSDKGQGAITTDPNRNRADSDVDDVNSPNPRGAIHNKTSKRDNRQAKPGVRNHSPDRLNEHPIRNRAEDPSRDGPRPR